MTLHWAIESVRARVESFGLLLMASGACCRCGLQCPRRSKWYTSLPLYSNCQGAGESDWSTSRCVDAWSHLLRGRPDQSQAIQS
eukprot:7195471-Pyramimonas_sp.AAC.1